MDRYIALSTDDNRGYCVYAPAVLRLWRKLGWKPIILLYNPGWTSPLARWVRPQIEEIAEQVVLFEGPVEPLTTPNLMRSGRLTLPAMTALPDNSQLLMSDIDMFPLRPTYFDRQYDLFALRADCYHNYESREKNGQRRLVVGDSRFPMCYLGAQVWIWRELVQAVPDDPVKTLHGFGYRYDDPGSDEATITARIMMSRFASADIRYGHEPEEPHHQQGELHMFGGRHDWARDGYPLRMVLGGTDWAAKSAIDMHCPRVPAPWMPAVLARYYPADADWFYGYFEEAIKLWEQSGEPT